MSPTTAQTGGYKFPIREIKGYLDGIQINPIRRTSLVSIDATAEDPAIASLMAARHANAYIDWVRSNRVEQQSVGPEAYVDKLMN